VCGGGSLAASKTFDLRLVNSNAAAARGGAERERERAATAAIINMYEYANERY
jgi:hypothetical protein